MTLRFSYLELLVVVGLADGGGVPAKPLKKLLPGTLGTTAGPLNGGLCPIYVHSSTEIMTTFSLENKITFLR
jgi:hypothetical protein